MRSIRRGDVYRVVFGQNKGHELNEPHYAVVVQSDVYPLSTVIVVPLSSSAKSTPWRVPVTVLGKRTQALVEQIRVVDIESRLKEWVCNLSGSSEMDQIDEELALIIGVHKIYRDAR